MLDSTSLKRWFLSEKRDLPWRENLDPYAVWISEVMLQQTQVSVVIPYFERWMKRFPTVKSLAEASEEEVIKEWEGLGYYSRARNLHQGARHVLKNYGGNIPDGEEELSQIKGLGPYTVGAIRSFAFHQRAPAVDGNVIRVLARYLAIKEDISQSSTGKLFRQILEQILPDSEPWVANEALIELGATVCGRVPKCESCPLKKSCRSYQEGTVSLFPVKTAKSKSYQLHRAVMILSSGDSFLVKKGIQGEIMNGLYEFPFIELDSPAMTPEQMQKKIASVWGIEAFFKEQFSVVKHSFTQYRVTLYPFLFGSEELREVKLYEWKTVNDLRKHAFSSGHRRIFNALLS